MHCIHQGKGDAIIFIHGMPTNRMLWDGIIKELSGHHRCFAVDLPGMGETPFIPYDPGYLDRLAKQIELLRVQHGVKKWHVVGHDAGSVIAVQYAALFSQHVACLALMSPAIFPELRPFYLLNALRKPLVEKCSLRCCTFSSGESPCVEQLPANRTELCCARFPNHSLG